MFTVLWCQLMGTWHASKQVLNSKIFYVFLLLLFYAHQACIYSIQNTAKNCNIVTYFYYLK